MQLHEQCPDKDKVCSLHSLLVINIILRLQCCKHQTLSNITFVGSLLTKIGWWVGTMLLVFAVAVHKKLFSFPSPQNHNSLAEKEIAKKNSLRNNCIEVLWKGLAQKLCAFHGKSGMNQNVFHDDCDDDSIRILYGRISFKLLN